MGSWRFPAPAIRHSRVEFPYRGPGFQPGPGRKALKAGQVPQPSAKKLRMITGVLHAELTGIVVILLCAAIMARGGWV